MHGLSLKKHVLIISFCCLAVIILSVLVILYIKQKKLEITEKKISNSVVFNEKENKIVDMINNGLNIYNYFDKMNLKSFEIVSLESFGYYNSKSNIRYIIVNYKVLCKDSTYDCDNLGIDKNYSIENNKPFIFWIKVDMESYDYIEKLDGGFSTSMNSDFVMTDRKMK